MFPVRPQFTRATRKAALTCLLRLSPLLCPCVHSSPAPLAKPHSRAYCGCRRFFARASTVHPRHSQSRTHVLTAAIAASLLSARPQFTRAIRKAALSCLPRLSPLLCSYTGAHSMSIFDRKTMRAWFSLTKMLMGELLLYIIYCFF